MYKAHNNFNRYGTVHATKIWSIEVKSFNFHTLSNLCVHNYATQLI